MLLFASSLSWRFSEHRMPIVRGLWFVGCVLGLVLCMRTVVPFLHKLV